MKERGCQKDRAQRDGGQERRVGVGRGRVGEGEEEGREGDRQTDSQADRDRLRQAKIETDKAGRGGV